MNKLLAATAILALLSAGPGFAQTATSDSTSGANSGSVSAAVNGGVTIGPIDASSRTTSTSDSNSVSGAISGSQSQGGDASSSSNAVTGPSNANAQTGASTASSVANPNANNAGNAQAITFNTTNPDSVKTVPQVYAPALTTTLTETCMGSTSGGASWLGGGFSLGSSWRDDECVRRLNARELSQTLGDREAARAILCGNKAIEEAYDRIGRPCPQSANYRPDQAQNYLPQAPVQVVMAPPAPPAPAPAAASRDVYMAPIPNPPESRPAKQPRGG